MEFTSVSGIDKCKKADLLVLPFWQGKDNAEPAAEWGKLADEGKEALKLGDFKGKEGEVQLIYSANRPEKRIAFIGLGEKKKHTTETLRRSYAALAKVCQAKKLKELNLLLPSHNADPTRGIAEGLLLPNYAFTKLKHDDIKNEPPILITKVNLVGADRHALTLAKKCADTFKGVYLARDLINDNADTVTPQYLAQTARDLAKKYSNVKATVFDKKRLEKEKMGLILAVGRGAAVDPALILLEYKGNPKSKDHTVIVGKGIVYDTGGLNIKPVDGMVTMKGDMSGAAAVLGTICSLAEMGAPVNVTAVVTSAENSVSATSYKPGDVYVSYTGRTVEVMDTDAEGRLVLADALAYACKNLNPSRIIDLATLTGACAVALGDEAIGLMSNDDALAESLQQSGDATFERVWRLPLFEEYKDLLKSHIADTKNIGGRWGGASIAAVFLQGFVGEGIPWAHLDIAGKAFLPEAKRYLPKHGVGIGVRLLCDFLGGAAPQTPRQKAKGPLETQ